MTRKFNNFSVEGKDNCLTAENGEVLTDVTVVLIKEGVRRAVDEYGEVLRKLADE